MFKLLHRSLCMVTLSITFVTSSVYFTLLIGDDLVDIVWERVFFCVFCDCWWLERLIRASASFAPLWSLRSMFFEFNRWTLEFLTCQARTSLLQRQTLFPAHLLWPLLSLRLRANKLVCSAMALDDDLYWTMVVIVLLVVPTCLDRFQIPRELFKEILPFV